MFFAPDLNNTKCDEQNSEEDEESNDATIGPWVFGSSPLQSEKHTNDGWQKGSSAPDIEFLYSVSPMSVRELWPFWIGIEDDDE